VGLPASKNALKKLGDRLSSGADPTPADDALLNAFILSYDEPAAMVQELVTQAGYPSTSRLKTRGTLIEKLARDPQTKLPSVQDVAGLRVTVENRVEQDLAVDRIRSALEASGCPVRVVDRRERPSHGYHAVHLIATVLGVPVEIQIRTVLQDLWAQVSERMGDRFGRAIRYGGPPLPTGDPKQDAVRLEVVTIHRERVAQAIATTENLMLRLHRLKAEREHRTQVIEGRLYDIEALELQGDDVSGDRLELVQAEQSMRESLSEVQGMLMELEAITETFRTTLLDQIRQLGEMESESRS
jgi:ppGpp synthetase/RelA/SpoT-type nucleotidyltranferase